MAHYAFLDENNVVTNVIVGKDEAAFDWETYYSMKVGQICKRTSYNTQAGEHTSGGVPFRKNFAGIGYKYDAQRDAFIPPQPYDSWNLNEQSCFWEPPIVMPQDGEKYVWDEPSVSWIKKEK